MAKSFIPRNVDFIIQNASRNESEVVFTANVIVTINPSGCFFNPFNALLKSSTEIKDFKGIFSPDLLACHMAFQSKSINAPRNSFDPCK